MKVKYEIPEDVAKAAFEMLWIMRDHLGNVIASENGGTTKDAMYEKKCKKYLKWYAKIKLNTNPHH